MTMTMKRTRMILSLLVSALCASDSMAFVNRPAASTKSTFLPEKTRKATTQRLSMIPDEARNDLAALAAPILTSTIAIPSGSLLGSASSIIDPVIESELLNDAAHVGLDLSTLVRPATAILRLSVVIGRICAILSDYLPDGQMNPEEVVFQALMLVVALGACLQSFGPLVLAATAKMSYRDGRAYSRMFQSLGISWTQYKAMVAVAVDWVQLEPHEHLKNDDDDDDEYMYWLYSGNAQLRCASSGKFVQNVTAGNGYNGLLGELKFAQLLDKNPSNVDTAEIPNPTIQAGVNGATLIRIHSQKLKMLMDQDEQLAESMKTLLLKGMHEKLSALMSSSSK